MNEMRCLLDRFWVVRDAEKELYYEIRRALPQYHRFVNELTGWNLIVNEAVIKLEKVPPRAMSWMGIQEFSDTMDYCLFCALLLYLADQDDGGQFLLSSLTDAIESFVADLCPVDWTRYSHRRSLVRVLRYAQDMRLVVVYDGNSEGFSNSREQEVLYENTGLSRHFTVHFGRDISHCNSVEDFEAFTWEGDGERGRQRINRVYRQLALAPALYWSESDRPDYDYIKNQRQWVDKYLDEALSGELQIHKNGAFFVLHDDNRFGACHPRDLALSDVTLLLCAELREQVNSGVFARRDDDMVLLTHREFQLQVTRCQLQYGNGWGSQLRALSPEKLCQELLNYMKGWMLLEVQEDYVSLCPAIAKLIGHYPKDYRGSGETEVEVCEPMEDA